jgi:hypothetical protein
MKPIIAALVVIAGVLCATPAAAQNLGTFRWQLQPYGSVLTLTVVQQGDIYLLDGFESQCGGNPTLPASGVAVPQANGSVLIGVTTVNERGHGLHTRAFVNLADFNGFWSDNAGNISQVFRFNPGETCPGGPRTDPTSPLHGGEAGEAATIQALQAQIAALTERLAALEKRKR